MTLVTTVTLIIVVTIVTREPTRGESHSAAQPHGRIPMTSSVRQAPDTPPRQGQLTPDNPDVTGIIRKGQIYNSGVLARISTPSLLFVNSLLFGFPTKSLHPFLNFPHTYRIFDQFHYSCLNRTDNLIRRIRIERLHHTTC
jgi:hypothetical protein